MLAAEEAEAQDKDTKPRLELVDRSRWIRSSRRSDQHVDQQLTFAAGICLGP